MPDQPGNRFRGRRGKPACRLAFLMSGPSSNAVAHSVKSNPVGKSISCKSSMKAKSKVKTTSCLVRLLLLVCALSCAQFPFARAADSVPTVATDQEDYPPFSVVWITGTGFLPWETVSNQVVQVEGPDAGAAYEPWGVVADSTGNFTTSWYVFSDELLDTTLRLTA